MVKILKKTESSLLFTGERKRPSRKNYVALASPFRSFALAWLTQNYSLIFSGAKDAEFILQASTKKTTLTSQTSKKTSPPLPSFLLLWSLEGLSDCKVKGVIYFPLFSLKFQLKMTNEDKIPL